MRAPAVPVLDDPFRAPADVGRAIPLATLQSCRSRSRRSTLSDSPTSARQRGATPRLDAAAQACNANRLHMHAAPGQPPTARPPFGDERGSVGTGTDERIRQERPTSTGFCIGERLSRKPVRKSLFQ